MNESYSNSVRNTVLSSKPSIVIRLLLMVLFVCLFGNIENVNAATRTASITGNWNNTATWGGSSVPTISDDVVIPNGKIVTVTADAFVKSIIVNNGGTLNVNSPVVLTVGTIGTSATTQVVDFQNGSKVTINTGAAMIVYGKLNNSNNSDEVKFDGVVSVDGNITVGNGSTVTGSGSLSSTGTVTGAGTVFTSTVGCTSGDGCYYGCSANVISYDQTICSGGTVALTGNTGAGYYQWQSSTTSSSIGFSDISGATSNNYASSALTTTTYFRRIVSGVSGCSLSNSNVVKVTVNAATSVGGTISGATAICMNSSTGTLTLSGHTGTIMQWERNINSGGWNNIGNGGNTTFSESPGYSPGTWEYRALIQSGSCTSVYSATKSITVYATPVGGGIYTGNTSICINSSTGSMNLTGYTGSVFRWEKRLLSSATWTNIANTTDTYSESPSVGGTWEYRALVGSGSCTSVYSAVRQVVVNPASVGGTVSGGSTPICQGASTGTLTLSGHTGTVVNWEKQLNGGGWNWAGGSTTTFSEIPYAAGTWQYRALVQSGNCTLAYSSTQTIVVSPTPVGGNVDYATTPICINTATTLNLSGSTGSVVQWEKRVNGGSWVIIANTTTTHSETPSSAGTWEYRALVGSGSCTAVYSSVTQVIVNPELTITLTNTNASVCPNTTTASFSYSATTGSPAACTVDFDSAANTAGFTDLSYIGLGGAPNTFSVNVPWAAAAGVYNATLTLKTDWPSCTSTVSYPVTVTVGVSTPVVGTITHPNCTVPTGSVVLSGLPASGTIYQTGTVVNNFPITGTSMTISGLAAGSYNFSASNGTCTSSTTGNVVINPVVTNTWNGSAWSNGTPNSNQKIVFSGNYPPAEDLDGDTITGCSCMITGNTKVVIKSGKTLAITNEVTVVGSGSGLGSGSLTFENTASLVQINNAAINSGNIIYKRTTSSVLTSDYTYWSSPVANHTLDISPSYVSGMFYSYNDFAVPEDWKGETAASEMVVGKGYIIRGPQITGPPLPPGLYSATFKGEPNNGIKTIAIGPRGTSNLLGNPYPSAIDADAFLATNSTLVEGTIYLWTHKTAIQLASNITNGTAGTGVLAYTSDDYASYNVTGGVGTGIGNFVNGVAQIANKPTGKIAAGQAFFTTSLGAGTVTFNNAMRLSSAGAKLDNTQFFKTKNPKGKTATTIEKNRVWLNMTNKEGAFKQTLVGYLTDATNDYDSRFDGESLDGNDFIDFYSINEDKNLVIQGRSLPFDEKDEVPLGYKTTIEGDFTINIDEVDGLLTNQSVFLEDKLTNTVVDLKAGNYTFNTAAGTFDDRFVLKYSSKTLSVDEADKKDGILVLYSNNYKTLIIQNKIVDATVNSVSLFNMSGQNIAVWSVKQWEEQTNIQIPIKNLSSGIYIVIVKTTKGESRKKIIVN